MQTCRLCPRVPTALSCARKLRDMAPGRRQPGPILEVPVVHRQGRISMEERPFAGQREAGRGCRAETGEGGTRTKKMAGF